MELTQQTRGAEIERAMRNGMDEEEDPGFLVEE